MANPLKVDPASPVPLYHQIAEAIRARIEAGELAPGEALEPLRQAAETWKVNLHTVRHAYAALARSGLVESGRGRRGTRVVGRGATRKARAVRSAIAPLDEFVARVAAEGRAIHGLGPAELATALSRLDRRGSGGRPRVWVLECSRWQCESHAAEIRERYDVEAQPWTLDAGEPPEGTLISTYFHYNDVRRLWPRRLSNVRFVTIHPDPGLRQRLAGCGRVVVAERDGATVEVVTSDLLALFDDDSLTVGPCVADDPAVCLERAGGSIPVLFSPRVWGSMSEEVRDDPRALELRYVFDEAELHELAVRLAWRPSGEAVA